MPNPDPAQLPHLLELLDDESSVVRESVLGKLVEFGPGLETELRQLSTPPSGPDLERLHEKLDEFRTRIEGFYREEAEGTVIRTTLFQVGELVRHRRYGYRGLVVARDLTCQADTSWYRNNRTRPDRDQPWYHVLVHGSDAVTYAAQMSLLPDSSKQEVDHILVPHFFEGFENGRYLRNAVEWPQSASS